MKIRNYFNTMDVLWLLSSSTIKYLIDVNVNIINYNSLWPTFFYTVLKDIYVTFYFYNISYLPNSFIFRITIREHLLTLPRTNVGSIRERPRYILQIWRVRVVSFSNHYIFSTCVSVPGVGRLLCPQSRRWGKRGPRGPPISPLSVTKEVTEVAPDVRQRVRPDTQRVCGTSCSPYVVQCTPHARVPAPFRLFLKRLCESNRRV